MGATNAVRTLYGYWDLSQAVQGNRAAPVVKIGPEKEGFWCDDRHLVTDFESFLQIANITHYTDQHEVSKLYTVNSCYRSKFYLNSSIEFGLASRVLLLFIGITTGSSTSFTVPHRSPPRVRNSLARRGAIHVALDTAPEVLALYVIVRAA